MQLQTLVWTVLLCVSISEEFAHNHDRHATYRRKDRHQYFNRKSFVESIFYCRWECRPEQPSLTSSQPENSFSLGYFEQPSFSSGLFSDQSENPTPLDLFLKLQSLGSSGLLFDPRPHHCGSKSDSDGIRLEAGGAGNNFNDWIYPGENGQGKSSIIGQGGSGIKLDEGLSEIDSIDPDETGAGIEHGGAGNNINASINPGGDEQGGNGIVDINGSNGRNTSVNSGSGGSGVGGSGGYLNGNIIGQRGSGIEVGEAAVEDGAHSINSGFEIGSGGDGNSINGSLNNGSSGIGGSGNGNVSVESSGNDDGDDSESIHVTTGQGGNGIGGDGGTFNRSVIGSGGSGLGLGEAANDRHSFKQHRSHAPNNASHVKGKHHNSKVRQTHLKHNRVSTNNHKAYNTKTHKIVVKHKQREKGQASSK